MQGRNGQGRAAIDSLAADNIGVVSHIVDTQLGGRAHNQHIAVGKRIQAASCQACDLAWKKKSRGYERERERERKGNHGNNGKRERTHCGAKGQGRQGPVGGVQQHATTSGSSSKQGLVVCSKAAGSQRCELAAAACPKAQLEGRFHKFFFFFLGKKN